VTRDLFRNLEAAKGNLYDAAKPDVMFALIREKGMEFAASNASFVAGQLNMLDVVKDYSGGD